MAKKKRIPSCPPASEDAEDQGTELMGVAKKRKRQKASGVPKKQPQHQKKSPPPSSEEGKVQKKNRTKQGSIPWHPFETEYGDHFETSPAAVHDIKHAVQALAVSLGYRDPGSLRIYDPYYCAGTVQETWADAGFSQCLNENKDCYKVWAAKAEPPHDAIITNPPFSGKHKERCIEYCVASGKPWLLLLPGYCATKQYFSRLTEGKQPIFFVPSSSYTFSHPEGTGHDMSPFFSMWMGCLGPHHAAVAAAASRCPNVRLAVSVNDLKVNRDVPVTKRPNPRQRRKMKRIAGT